MFAVHLGSLRRRSKVRNSVGSLELSAAFYMERYSCGTHVDQTKIRTVTVVYSVARTVCVLDFLTRKKLSTDSRTIRKWMINYAKLWTVWLAVFSDQILINGHSIRQQDPGFWDSIRRSGSRWSSESRLLQTMKFILWTTCVNYWPNYWPNHWTIAIATNPTVKRKFPFKNEK